MNQVELNKLLEEIVDRNKWKEIVDHFVDVLKISIFLVDFEGRVVIPPSDDRFGWSFFTHTCLGEALDKKTSFLTKFQQAGEYLEYDCVSSLQSFAIPIGIEQNKTLIYLVVGPVILNRREGREYYEEKAKLLKIDADKFWETVNETRVVSNLTMKSILDLLAQVGREVIELNLEKKRLAQMRINEQALPQNVSQAAQEIYARIHLDELLITLLDIALKMTNTECGSIMMLEENDELAVKATRGIEEDRLQRVRLGEGVSGVAAKENETFIIHGTQGEKRIQGFLRRPEIKSAIVMPLSSQNKVFGVLNLHTKKDSAVLESLDNLQYLSRLIVAAFQSI